MSLVSHRFLRDGRDLPPELEDARVQITDLARRQGLDFYETRFVMCSYEEINMLAAYGGFPQRYPHWRFGMDFLQMQKSYEFGLSKIYEMVINTNPSYAYLMDCNLFVDQKLVMAHVYGHVDFFKNNLWFAHTNRRMLDTMANHAAKVRRIMDRQGVTEVERFIELCLSIDNLIDVHGPHIRRRAAAAEGPPQDATPQVHRLPASDYMDRHINPPELFAAQRRAAEAEPPRHPRMPAEPERCVMGFLLDHAPLAAWQREILQIVRDEAYYFAPQGQTKIMNEGWATYWHTKMMTEHILRDDEVIDYADHHAGTVATRPGQLNPYALGVQLFRHIEDRWNKGQFGKDWIDEPDLDTRRRLNTGAMQGKAKIFEVRRTHNDVSFIDAFLTEDFVREQGMFTTQYDPRAKRWVIDSREFQQIKQQVLSMIASRGAPRVWVLDANAHNRGELLLHHGHEGMDLDLSYADRVLGNLAGLWNRPVLLQTTLEGKPVHLRHDGAELKQAKGHIDTEVSL